MQKGFNPWIRRLDGVDEKPEVKNLVTGYL
jgi:hypothetical protein